MPTIIVNILEIELSSLHKDQIDENHDKIQELKKEAKMVE